MKLFNRFGKAAGLIALCTAVSVFSLAGCSSSGGSSGSGEVTLSSIAITTQPTKTTYEVGETIDLTGLEVTATYSDKTTEIVDNADLTVSGFDSTAVAASQTVTVTYDGKTATFTVVITNVSQAGTATNLTYGTGTYNAYLGADTCQVTVSSVKVDNIEQLTTTPVYVGTSYVDGTYASTWNDYTNFQGLKGLGDTFTLQYTFTEKTGGAYNWNNWAFALNDGTNTWYLRADNYSNSTLASYSNVNYTNSYSWTSFSSNFTDKTLVLTVTKTASSIVASLSADGTTVYTATATPPASTMSVWLGGEACQLTVSSMTINGTDQLSASQTYGTDSGSGVYTLAFNTALLEAAGLSITDDWTVAYTFVENSTATQYYYNWLVNIVNNYTSGSLVVRADSYGWNGATTLASNPYSGVSYTSSYDWTTAATMCATYSGKTTVLTITKTSASIVISASVGGTVVYTATCAASS